MVNIPQQLDQYTKLSSSQRRKSLKWLSRQSEELLLVSFERQRDEYFKLSKIDEDNKSLLYLSAFYISVYGLYSTLNGKQGKNRAMNIGEVKDVTSLQAKQFKRHLDSEKWDKLLNLKSKILKLKDDEGLSFRELSEFLLRYHRLEVSHTYVANFYRKISEEI